VAEMVKEGAVQRLLDADLNLQASKDCVQKTLKRLEEKCHDRPLRYLLYVLRPALRARAPEKETARKVATALAQLCKATDAPEIFGAKGGLDVLFDMLTLEPTSPAAVPRSGRASEVLAAALRDEAAQRESARALVSLTEKCALDNNLAPSAPDLGAVRLPESLVNSPVNSDVTFVVGGIPFYAHRNALQDASDTFRAMFEGCYKERDVDAKIEIPNIPRDVFEAMMTCIYTGTVHVTPDIAQELLRAADQYLLSNLKRLCEAAIGAGLNSENLLSVFELAETYHADGLAHACVLYALRKRAEYVKEHGFSAYTDAIKRMMPTCRAYFKTALEPKPEAPPPVDMAVDA